MATRMQVTHRFDADVETVYALATDPAFIERKYADQDATDVSVVAEDTGGGGCRLDIRRTMTLDLPGFAKRVMQPTNTLVQVENWGAADASGRRICTYTVEVQGIPSRIAGTVTLSPDGTDTRQDIEADVKVSIPLLGGRLEKFAVESGTASLRDEAAFTDKELATR